MANGRVVMSVAAVLAASWLLVNVASVPAAELFHSGRTVRCEGCHSFGASVAQQKQPAADTEGTAAAPEPSGGPDSRSGAMMLRGSDPSSTCLLCHEAPAAGAAEEHYVSTPVAASQSPGTPAQLTPAGDFGWLRKNYQWQGEGGGIEVSRGESHGHNIVAMDFNYTADTALRTAPGGTYPASALSCISCHDPHGNYRRTASGAITTAGATVIASGSYDTSPNPDAKGAVGSYRLLAGKGYQPKSQPAAGAFTADPPAAVAPSSYNRPESASDTRVAYGSGMSEWCQNCHTQIHNGGAGGHPTGNDAKLSGGTMSVYNNYVGSGNLNGTESSSYSSLVPYEMGTGDYVLLKATANSNGANLKGPDATGGIPNVMCLSCHRAHASGWDHMTRWNMNSTFIVYNGRYPGIDNGAPSDYAQGRTEAETRKSFYERRASRFAVFQRSLCNKCHAQD